MNTQSNDAARTARALLQPEFLILYVGMLLASVVVMLSSRNFGVPKESAEAALNAPNGVNAQIRDAEVVAPAAVPPRDASKVERTIRPGISSRAPAPSSKASTGPDHSRVTL